MGIRGGVHSSMEEEGSGEASPRAEGRGQKAGGRGQGAEGRSLGFGPEQLRLLNIGGSEEVQGHQIIHSLGRQILAAADRETYRRKNISQAVRGTTVPQQNHQRPPQGLSLD